jgi:hypothetical protein
VFWEKSHTPSGEKAPFWLENGHEKGGFMKNAQEQRMKNTIILQEKQLQSSGVPWYSISGL